MKAFFFLSSLSLTSIYLVNASPLPNWNTTVFHHPVWAQGTPASPTCYIAPGQFGSPQAWVDAGMDNYLTSFAQAQPGLWQDTIDFLPRLMSYFNWYDYSCLSDAQNDQCSPTPGNRDVSNCTAWLNQQIDFFEGYMNSNAVILQTIHDHVSTWGESIFDSFWQNIPASVNEYDATGLLESIINGAIGLIPEVGGIFSAINSAAEAAVGGLANGGGVVPDPGTQAHNAWVSINTAMEVHIANLTSTINNYSREVVKSNAVLTEVTKGGAFFLPNATSLQPNPEAVWDKVEPYWASQIAMGAMKAQEVFLLSVPSTLSGNNGPCTQSIADSVAKYVSSASGAAWCASTGQVVVPVIGPIYGKPNVYTFGSFTDQTLSATGSSKSDILTASSSCYAGFGTANPAIQMYKTTDQQPQADGTYDMSASCAWSLPICDYATWEPVMEKQCDADWTCGSITKPTWTNEDKVINTAQWCAYQFGFVNDVWMCEEDTFNRAPIHRRECGAWGSKGNPQVPKVFKLS